MKAMLAWLRSISWPTVIASWVIAVLSSVILNYSDIVSNLSQMYNHLYQIDRWSGNFSNAFDFVDGVDMERRGFDLSRKEVVHFDSKIVNGRVSGYIDVNTKNYPFNTVLFDGKINLFGDSADVVIFDIVAGERKDFCKANIKLLSNAIEIDSNGCQIVPSGKFVRHPF